MKAIYKEFQIKGENHKLLILNYVDEDSRKKLYSPRLKYILFRYSEGIYSTHLNSAIFQDKFSVWASTLASEINDAVTTEEKIVLFNKSIKELVLVGQKEKAMTRAEVLGFYGELYFLKTIIDKGEQYAALKAWQRPAPAIHDFDFPNHSVEIKAFGRNTNEIRINSIDQLSALEGKELFLACFRFSINHSENKDSIGELFTNIHQSLSPTSQKDFEQKCFESKFAPYGGPDNQFIPYDIRHIESKIYRVDQRDFPRISRTNIPEAVTAVHYDISIPSMANYLIDYEFKI